MISKPETDDWRIAQFLENLYQPADQTKEETPVFIELPDHMVNSTGARVSIDFALKKAELPYIPVDQDRYDPEKHLYAQANLNPHHPFDDNQMPEHVSFDEPVSMTLKFNDDSAQELSIPVHLFISGQSEYDITVRASKQIGLATNQDELHSLLYAAIPYAISTDECTSWDDLKSQRNQLARTLWNTAGTILGHPLQAFHNELSHHMNMFDTRLQFPTTSTEITVQNRVPKGKFIVRYEPGTGPEPVQQSTETT